MLKGVNKQILEVTNPESPYFEKIIFFVKSSAPVTDSKKLKQEAEKISLSTAVKPPKTKLTKARLLSFIANTLLGSLAGIAIYYVICDFILR